MGTLLDLRDELEGALRVLDVTTYNHLPGAAMLPSAIVLAGSPYVESGQTFGAHLVRFEVWLSAAKGDNQSETNQLDEMTEAAITALLSDDWVIEGISQPFEFPINNGSAYTSSITVTTPVTF